MQWTSNKSLNKSNVSEEYSVGKDIQKKSYKKLSKCNLFSTIFNKKINH